ncbi:creatininase family protein [Myxococcota bacterium]|nr:creatininase family protein [Myxococcota bacterium]
MPTALGNAWREGFELLSHRVAQTPQAVAEAFATRIPAPVFGEGLPAKTVRRVLTTGLGSSAGHARYLAALIESGAGIPARFVPSGEFWAGRSVPARDTALIVFSQGLSPNARFALREVDGWGAVVLFTAASEGTAEPDVRGWLEWLRARGVVMIPVPGRDEFGTLLRVIGPLSAYAVALRFVQALVHELHGGSAASRWLDCDTELLVRILREAPGHYDRIAAPWRDRGSDFFSFPPALLASGSYAELIDNLRFKLMEGLLRTAPPIWDPLEFAHGPFQQGHSEPGLWFALVWEGDEHARFWLERVEGLLHPDRHALISFSSSLAPPLAIFEHEALLNQFVLDRVKAEGIDVGRWPGRGADGPLYDLAPELPKSSAPSSSSPAPSPGAFPTRASLAASTWPELEAALQNGTHTAVVPLGSTEQHGPHLPFETDTLIADALAMRFCERVEGAVHLPAVAIGCASEHLDFPGTLSVAPDTLMAVLEDLLASIRTHGFSRAYVFTAHGGNVALLRGALDRLVEVSDPLHVVAFTDHSHLTQVLHDVAQGLGVEPASAGHHAGEIETSILAGLLPGVVRGERLAQGRLHTHGDPQELFYPSLREEAASGVVGDPRDASAARSATYLDAWVEVLVEHYLRAYQLA